MNRDVFKVEKLTSQYNEVEILRYFAYLPYACILDSSLVSSNLGRYTVIGYDPFLIFQSKEKKISVKGKLLNYEKEDDLLLALKYLLKEYKAYWETTHIPFLAGCMGYFSYDLLHQIENVSKESMDDMEINDIDLGFYNKSLVIDHNENEIYAIGTSSGAEVGEDKDTFAQNNLTQIKVLFNEIIKGIKENEVNKEELCFFEGDININSNFDKASYIEMINKAREYIRNGDIFQVNLAQRFEAQIKDDPVDLYLRLRESSPAPFSSYLNFGEVKIISSSPERFIKIRDGKIETRPIKGTRPRGKDKIQDEAMRNELSKSQKDAAELTMIVDLERNDIGRVCKIGSVNVKKHAEIEEYANVFHLVSTVEGELREDVDIVDVIKATFPGGSITGAPKIRAMEIIEELEPVKRNVYTGAIGYIGFDGSCDLNIAIRTIVIKNNKAYYSVGGGIVWDSNPEDEYNETLHKGKMMMKVLKGEKKEISSSVDNTVSCDDMSFLYGFSVLETFLVNRSGSVFLKEKHIERLMNSLDFFEIELSISANNISQMIEDYIRVNELSNKVVRLTVGAGNKSKGIKPSIVFSNRENTYTQDILDKGCCICVSDVIKSENAITIAHKTSNYLENYYVQKKVKIMGYDDAIFRNTKSYVTETTKSNIFFIKDKVLHTPSLDCGLLPGIIRAWVVEYSKTLGIKCVEGKYKLEDFINADEVFVTNSVHGIMHVNSIDGKILNEGNCGEITKKLQSKKTY